MPNTPQTETGFSYSGQLLRVLFFLGMMILPVIVLTYYAISVSRDSIDRRVDAENFALLYNVRNQVLPEVEKRIDYAEFVGGNSRALEIAETTDPVLMNDYLKLVVTDIGTYDFERAFVVSATGALWAAYPTTQNETYDLQTGYGDRDWFDAVTKTSQVAVSGVYNLKLKGQDQVAPFVTVATPVLSAGKIVAIIALEWDVSRLNQIVTVDESEKETFANYTATAFVLDHERRPIIHPAIDFGNTNPEAGLTVSDAFRPIPLFSMGFQAGEGAYIDPVSGEAMLAMVLPIEVGTEVWAIVAQQQEGAVQAQLNDVAWSIGLIGFVLLAVTLVVLLKLAGLSKSNLQLTSELTQKNALLRESDAIVRTSNDAIIGLETDWTIKSWNRAAETLYGLPSTQMIHQPFLALAGPENEQKLAEARAKLDSGEELRGLELSQKRASGETFPAALTLSRIIDENGKLEGISAIVRDITAQKEVEQIKNDFISFVSHQLKAPVTAIKFILEGIMDGDDGPVSEALQSDVVKMQQVAEGQFKLISDILNASRVERGVVELDRKVVPVMAAVERAMRDYIEPYKQKGLYLTVNEQAPGLLANMDTDKVAEAISNAISNAWKYTETGGVTITVSAQNGFAVVDVTDTGKGMDDVMIGKLFSRDKVMGKNTNAQGSSGLGLYIAKNFLTMHGGDVTVSSKVGVGTTFRYTIPLAESPLAAGSAPTA